MTGTVEQVTAGALPAGDPSPFLTLARVAAASFLTSFALLACSSLRFVDVASENQGSRVEHLVMHFTSVDFARSMRMLTERGERPVSAHYLVPENGDPTYPHRRLRVCTDWSTRNIAPGMPGGVIGTATTHSTQVQSASKS